jgi:hypothetical protein
MKHLPSPILFLALLGFLSLSACRKEVQLTAGGCAPLVDQLIYPQDSVISLSAQLAGDCIELTIGYGGGCAEHDFALHWGGEMLYSLPPVATLTLLHDGYPDGCDALLWVDKSFDVSSLHALHPGPVTVRVVAAGVEPIELTY